MTFAVVVMDQILDSFESAWHDSTTPPTIADFLPTPGSGEREAALHELIKIDLERRWRDDGSATDAGRPMLEHYFEQFPELGSFQSCPPALIAHEYRVRSISGDQPTIGDYQQRFRDSDGKLPQLLQHVADTIAAGTAHSDGTMFERSRSSKKGSKKKRTRKPSVSGEEFLKRAVESELVTQEQIDAAIAKNGSDISTAEEYAKALVREKLLTAYQAQSIYKGRGRQLILGNYVILDKIGEGGMGLVLKAEHKRMKRVVALKVLSPSVSKSPELTARFQREVRAAARLDHPNIVTAFDADEAGKTHFFVMQYVDGVDLASRVKKKGPFAVDKAVDCIKQAAAGLQYAHDQGIVHRDIKPGNLLLDATGTVKILDMGLARMDSTGDGTQAELTSTGAVMGTVDYMAPEQALSTKSADARSDIYSLGITLWYLITGRPAYHGDSLMARLLAHREHDVPSLSAARAEAPPALDAVFRRMVAKKPEDRPQTMSAVVQELEQAMGGETSSPSISLAPSEDDKLDDFLLNLDGADSSVVKSKPSSAPVTRPITQPPAPTIPPPVKTPPRSSASIPVQPAMEGDDGLPAKYLWIGGACLSVLLIVVLAIVFWPNGDGGDPPDDAGNGGDSGVVGKTQAGNGGGKTSSGGQTAKSAVRPPDPAPGRAVVPFDAKQAAAKQRAWAKHLGVPVEYTNNVGMKFRLIPPGEYQRGLTQAEIDKFKRDFNKPDSDINGYLDAEGPPHTVIINRPFYLGITEVTQGQYKQVTGRSPSYFTSQQLQVANVDNYPVENISWNIVVDFCKDLSKFAGVSPGHMRAEDKLKLTTDGYRLPTEAEWEFACRAGSATMYWSGDSADGVEATDWISSNGNRKTRPVGTKQANPFGLHDLLGNVQEWCRDGWEPIYYSDFEGKFAVDPKGPEFYGFDHVVRGGHYGAGPPAIRSGYRSKWSRQKASHRIGFRVAMSVDAVKVLTSRKPVVRVAGKEPERAVVPFLPAKASQLQRDWAAHLKKPQAYTNSIGMRFELIPPGDFQMGSTDAEIKELVKGVVAGREQSQVRDEAPRHKVTLSKPYYLGTYEVRVKDYVAIMKGNPNHGPRGDNHPAGMVPWHLAVEFCNKLSRAEKLRSCYMNKKGTWVIDPAGTGYRLPTEAEWEFACRAGTSSRWHFGNDPKLLDQYAQFNARTYTSFPVGQKKPNAFGLHDMLGNHWEWCHDFYAAYPNALPITDPTGPASGKNRVVRGGFSMDGPDRMRSARRRWNDPGPTYPGAGFRVVLVIPMPKSK